MGRFRYVIADVFTDTPLQGNQVAVFTDARELPEDKLQKVAREMNLSETVFVYKPEGEGHARIRIFTPQNELMFAGHPCLGTAFVLGAPLQLGTIALETGNGIVPVELLLARTDTDAVLVTDLRAYPTGLEFALTTRPHPDQLQQRRHDPDQHRLDAEPAGQPRRDRREQAEAQHGKRRQDRGAGAGERQARPQLRQHRSDAGDRRPQVDRDEH